MDDFEMPELIDFDDAIKLCARLNHDYDEDYWYEIDLNRKFLREYLLWVDKTNSLEDCSNTSDLFIDLWKKKENFAYSIVLKETEKVIGSIDVHNIDPKNNQAEIGYWLAEEYNGRGFMSKAVKMIEKEAFNRGMHRLVIKVQEGNIPSSRVAERNNYIFEGKLKDALYMYDEYFDELVYAKINNS